MDTVTQMLFGATLAQAGFRRRLGRRSVVAGAAVALVPDLDIAILWTSGPFPYWVHHRGLTHSIFFAALAGPVFGWLLHWFAAPKADASGRSTLPAWMWLAILALATHPVLDVFTSYGTQILWPLTTHRFAIDALPIIDPVYSGMLIIALLVGVFAGRRMGLAQAAGQTALMAVTAYTLIGWALNEQVRAIGREAFQGAYGTGSEITAYPLIFQPYYRRILATTPDAAYVGYYSVLAPAPIEWTVYPYEKSAAIDALRATPEGRILDWFAMGRVLWRATPATGGTAPTSVEGLDLRYGMIGTDPSFWGVRANAEGDRLTTSVSQIRTLRDADNAAIRDYWRRIFGS